MMRDNIVAIIAAETLNLIENNTRSVAATAASRESETNPNKLKIRTQKERKSVQAQKIVRRRNPLFTIIRITFYSFLQLQF